MNSGELVPLEDTPLSQSEQVQQRETILASRHCDGDVISIRDHFIVTNGLVGRF